MLVFATAKLGVVLVPINFMLNADEIAFILGHSGASAMVADDALIATAEKAIGDTSIEVRGGLRGGSGAARTPRRAGRTSRTGGGRARPTTPRSRWPTTIPCA